MLLTRIYDDALEKANILPFPCRVVKAESVYSHTMNGLQNGGRLLTYFLIDIFGQEGITHRNILKD